MISNLNKKERKDDLKILSYIIAGFLFVVWLCTPPGNKFAQICFYGNNTQYLIAKLTKPKEEINEWLFFRNNAIYLAKMERKYSSLKEMDKAIRTFPNYLSDKKLNQLYTDRAELRLFWKEYKLALDDFLRLESPSMKDRFKIALLYKEVGNNREALSYCNSVLSIDYTAYMGYACLADIYAGVGRYETSVKVYDLLIDKSKNRARYYADRAYYKLKSGDNEGANADLNKAKELSPIIDPEITIIKDTLNPKKLDLSII